MNSTASKIIEHEPSAVEPSTPVAPDTGWLQQAITNPNTDVSKLERLEAMYERMTARGARAAYDVALAKMQQELPVIRERGSIKNSSGKVQSTYALWEDLNEQIKPVLSKHGFSLSFRTGQHDGKIVVTGILSRDGHREETTLELPHDSSGSKNPVQAVGSSTSYGKRYTAAALLNLTSRGEDDDGKAAGDDAPITDQQVGELTAIIESVGADKAKFLKYMKAESLADIPSAQFQRAVAALNAKRAKPA